MKTPNKWTGWRYGALIGGLVGAIGLALYPIVVQPMLDPSHYSRCHFLFFCVFGC